MAPRFPLTPDVAILMQNKGREPVPTSRSHVLKWDLGGLCQSPCVGNSVVSCGSPCSNVLENGVIVCCALHQRLGTKHTRAFILCWEGSTVPGGEVWSEAGGK